MSATRVKGLLRNDLPMGIEMGARGAHVHQSRRHLRRTSPCRKEHIATSESMLNSLSRRLTFRVVNWSCLSEVMHVAVLVAAYKLPKARGTPRPSYERLDILRTDTDMGVQSAATTAHPEARAKCVLREAVYILCPSASRLPLPDSKVHPRLLDKVRREYISYKKYH